MVNENEFIKKNIENQKKLKYLFESIETNTSKEDFLNHLILMMLTYFARIKKYPYFLKIF